MRKITAKTTKQELKDILNVNVKAVQEADSNLYERIVYTGKMSKEDDSKVTRKDLVDLVNEVVNVLGDKFVEPTPKAEETPKAEPKAENSVKLKGGKKKAESKEEPAETPTEEPTEEPKVDEKKSKKSLGKNKKEQSKEGVTVLKEEKNPKAVLLAKMFPQTLEVGETKYELAPDIKTMDDLHTALSSEDSKEIVFAFYWTKRHLRQFPYFGELLGQPTSFDNDLDIATALYVSDEKKVAYALSAYTEAFYTIMPQSLVEEDGIRFCDGIEFQVYRAI